MVRFANAHVQLPGFRLGIGNIRLEPGFYWLQGPNGSGKTTFLRTIIGAQPLSEGTISFARQYQLGFVPQSYRESLIPWMSGWSNLCLLDGPRVAMVRCLKRMGFQLSDLTKRPPQLSGGQCQRIALVREVQSHSTLLLLDEPFSAMDVKSTDIAWRLLIEQFRNQESIVLLSLHHLGMPGEFGGFLKSLYFRRATDDRAEVSFGNP